MHRQKGADGALLALETKKNREVQEEGRPRSLEAGAGMQQENNQQGDLLYLFTPFLPLNRKALLIKEVDHFREL